MGYDTKEEECGQFFEGGGSSEPTPENPEMAHKLLVKPNYPTLNRVVQPLSRVDPMVLSQLPDAA